MAGIFHQLRRGRSDRCRTKVRACQRAAITLGRFGVSRASLSHEQCWQLTESGLPTQTSKNAVDQPPSICQKERPKSGSVATLSLAFVCAHHGLGGYRRTKVEVTPPLAKKSPFYNLCARGIAKVVVIFLDISGSLWVLSQEKSEDMEGCPGTRRRLRLESTQPKISSLLRFSSQPQALFPNLGPMNQPSGRDGWQDV